MNTIKTWQERAEGDRAYWGQSDERPYMRAEIEELRAALADRATPAQPVQANKQTDLSRRLRAEANSPHPSCVNKNDLRAAAEEIERYYTGMLNWKATAEAQNVKPSPSTVAEAIRKLPLPEPLEINWPQLNSNALGCGVEDRNIRDRYEAAEYGWQDGVDKAVEHVPEDIYTADQVRELLSEAAALAEQVQGQQWISVKDRLPEQCDRAYQVAAICTKKYGDDTNYAGQGVRGIYQDWVIRKWPQNFTHWMPLPAAPIASEQKSEGA